MSNQFSRTLTMKVFLPYHIKDLDAEKGLQQKRWVWLNRYYMPLGLGGEENPREPEEYLSLLDRFVVRFPGLKTTTIQSLASSAPDFGDDQSFYLYNDATSPW